MRLLICSDGSDKTDQLARLGGLVAGSPKAAVTLLGIAEDPQGEEQLRAALRAEAGLLRDFEIAPEVIVRTGEPIDEILQQTNAEAYDLVVIGARIKRRSGQYWRSQRTYELIKSIPTAVLVVSGQCERLSKFLVCTGGKRHIEAAVELIGQIAANTESAVTLLHVMAKPPGIFVDLVRRAEDVETLLTAGSELGENLREQKERLQELGVAVEVRVRHGFVLDQIFAELQEGEYDMLVTGSSRARGALGHYIMGDLTREIVNRAECPVLVVRTGEAKSGGVWTALKRIFAS
ncbi:MAG TPA: universal stress protein [Chthoniobacterales bacterium]|nr:universal stress protein [Chthoniobacterales bacterium]